MRYLLLFFPLEFYLIQNNYFGWNSHPKSDSELIADGITFLLVVLTLILIKLCGSMVSLNIQKLASQEKAWPMKN